MENFPLDTINILDYISISSPEEFEFYIDKSRSEHLWTKITTNGCLNTNKMINIKNYPYLIAEAGVAHFGSLEKPIGFLCIIRGQM